jgi:hypothetical protein
MLVCKKNLAFERLSQEDCESETSLGYIERSCLKKQQQKQKNKTNKKPRLGCNSVVECLPSMCEVLGSIFTAKKEKNK